MLRPARPFLEIPESHTPASSHTASPSSIASGNRTGRPSAWSSSALRKMIRLYVYTNLPKDKIIEIVHDGSGQPPPTESSALKWLTQLLDKQFRWLRPMLDTDTDMGRRCGSLACSPIRTAPNSPGHHGRPHSSSEPPWPSGLNALGEADYTQRPDYAISESAGDSPSQADRYFAQFVQRTTFMSTSSGHTTGSFERLLPQFSDAKRCTIRRLVKRFTSLDNDSLAHSPMTDVVTTIATSTDNPDAPTEFHARPFPLPGDFLALDIVGSRRTCSQSSEEHRSRSCLCSAQADISWSPWSYPAGLTDIGTRLVFCGIDSFDVDTRDEFNNTVLHFLAARAPARIVLAALSSGLCDDILNIKNTANQTFLHLLRPEWFSCGNYFFEMLHLLDHQLVDLNARDDYGQTFFHRVLLEAPKEIRQAALELYIGASCGSRDAFGIQLPATTTPRASREDVHMQDADWDPIMPTTHTAQDPWLLFHIRRSVLFPRMEDDEGHNGLHCLGLVTLSLDVAKQKFGEGPDASKTTNRPRGKANTSDSCTERLKYRRKLLQDLIAAGVDPNSYDKTGHTPLMVFAAQLPEDDDYKIGPAILGDLVAHGANIDARSRAGETALQIAVRNGRKLAARTLVELHANIHVRDAMGRSLLDIVDIRFANSRHRLTDYAHYEACRGYLTGLPVPAKQNPSVLDEWAASEEFR